MPARRTRRPRRRRRKPRGDRAMRAVRNLSKFVDRELHVLDLDDNSSIQNAVQFFHLSGIADGTLVNQRNGVQVTLRHLRLRLLAVTGTGNSRMRVIVLKDRQPDGAFPAPVDLFTNVGSTEGTILSPFNVTNKKRFKILFDRTWTCNPVIQPTPLLARSIPLNFKVTYNAPGNGIAQVVTNSLILVQLGLTAGGAASPDVEMAARITFAP